MMSRKKFKVQWYDQFETKYVEPTPIYAENEEEARAKAYLKYGGKNTPGPLISVEEIE